MGSYCAAVRGLPRGNVHREHHDTEHGFAPADDDDLFRRLMLEISQAGLSFDTVLKKKAAIYATFSSVEKVAAYGEKDILALLNNRGIIRHRGKIEAAIHNAKRVQELQKSHGSFQKWLDQQGALSREEWTTLFKKTFRFTGGEIVNEFLMSTGHLPGAHTKGCRFYKKRKADQGRANTASRASTALSTIERKSLSSTRR